jgi:IclR family acetate operon transcriptional repressor
MATPLNQSIVKAFDIIAIVCASTQSRSLRELAVEADLSLASTHRILGTLKTLGAVRMTRGGYELGARLAALRRRDLESLEAMRAQVQGELDALARTLGGRVSLSALSQMNLMVVVAEGGSRDASDVGNGYEPYFSAPGKMLLSGLPSSCLSDYIAAAPLVALTANTIVDPAKLTSEVKRIRLCGYATDNGECRDGMAGVAVALRSGARAMIGALAVDGSAERLPQRAILDIVGRLCQTARTLERMLAENPKFIDITALLGEV